MQTSKHYINSFVNADDEPNILSEGEAINAINMRFGTTDGGKTGRWENVLSNQERQNTLPEGDNTVIGHVSDDAEQYSIVFIHNSQREDLIYLYQVNEGAFWTVLRGNLGFRKDSLIHAALVNNILFWTDGVNEPRRINLGAAIKCNHSGDSPIASDWAYTDLSDAVEYSLIRRPPCLAGSIVKETDTAYVNNFVQNESFQFAYQYIYYDGEMSVLSGWTTSSRLNAAGDTYNRIKIVLDREEMVPGSVRLVRLVARQGGEIAGSILKTFVVKTWDREEDGVALQAHNDGTPLTFYFYNDLSGETIDAATSVTPFHSVPLLSGALEVVQNRLFLGDNTEGYNTPAVTSLEVGTSSIAGGAESLDKYLTYYMSEGVYKTQPLAAGIWWRYAAWYVEISELNAPGYQKGFYVVKSAEKLLTPEWVESDMPTAPTSVAVTDLEYVGGNTSLIAQRAKEKLQAIATVYSYLVDRTEITNTALSLHVTGINTTTYNVFKSKSQYRLGVVFYDRAMRKCGVVTDDTLKVNIPSRDYGFTSGVGAIEWTLNNTDASNEIPEWAHYYAVVMTKNLRTRFFLQAIDTAPKYATKDAEGNYVFTSTTFTNECVAIALDSTALIQANLGYTFSEGDMCVLTDNLNAITELPVLGVEGKYILIAPKDLGPFSAKKFIYELYTPYKTSEQEPFYEMGEIHAVNNPGAPERTFSIAFGTIAPDGFTLTRNYGSDTYFAEAMCPNDKFYRRWDTDHGRVNIVTSEGQRRKKTGVSFSNTYIPGTGTNGLCTFEALNDELLPFELGTIEKLILTSKVQDEGTVLLAIGTNQTASIYIGETQVLNADASSYFVKSDGIIGQVNVLRGGYGTLNPESVVLFEGRVWWWDILRGVVVQYSANGLYPVSNNKFRRVIAEISKKFLSTPAATMEGYGSRPFIFGGVDPFHREVYFTVPKLDTVVPRGQLSDYVEGAPDYVGSADYPYDPLDYRAKTLVYKMDYDRWMGEFSWTPEGFATVLNRVLSFKGGKLYEHNISGNYDTFYGLPHRSRLAFVNNVNNTVKTFHSLALETSEAPEWVHFRSEWPYEQSTDLIAEDFKQVEGIFEAPIQRDRLSPNVSGDYYAKQLRGDRMRTQALMVLLQFNSVEQVFFRLATMRHQESSGHK